MCLSVLHVVVCVLCVLCVWCMHWFLFFAVGLFGCESPIAQLVERAAVNLKVAGSNPAGRVPFCRWLDGCVWCVWQSMRMRELLTRWWLTRWCPSGLELVRGGGCAAPSVGSLGGFHAAVVTREGECRAEAKDKWETKACG